MHCRVSHSNRLHRTVPGAPFPLKSQCVSRQRTGSKLLFKVFAFETILHKANKVRNVCKNSRLCRVEWSQAVFKGIRGADVFGICMECGGPRNQFYDESHTFKCILTFILNKIAFWDILAFNLREDPCKTSLHDLSDLWAGSNFINMLSKLIT